ncbi:MAG: hypothetical protein GXP33_07550 [Spirochaetes bacterium]|nr:hypothetical protein [Spirochaetota bacterium]
MKPEMIEKETDLFKPVKSYLEHNGYKVHAEVDRCDVVAEREGKLTIVELKKHFSVALLAQAVERQRITDRVYVAVPVPDGRTVPFNYSGMVLLLKRLEIGLLLVHISDTAFKVEAALHPSHYNVLKDRKRQRTVTREIKGRVGEYNTGGSRAADKQITLYRQNTVQVALYLNILGPSSPAALRSAGTCQKTGSILRKNYYGWFIKPARGLYELSKKGREDLNDYPELSSYYRSLFYKRFPEFKTFSME